MVFIDATSENPVEFITNGLHGFIGWGLESWWLSDKDCYGVTVVHGSLAGAIIENSIIVIISRDHLEVIFKPLQRPESSPNPKRPIGSAFIEISSVLLDIINNPSHTLVASSCLEMVHGS